MLYCAIVPLFCGPPLAVMMAVSSAKDMRRISATIATASLKSSKSIRRSPLSLTLEKMRSTCTGVRDRLFCRPVSLQNLAHMLPSIVSSCAAPPARPKLAKERKVLRRVANRPDPPRDAPISGSESESSGRFSNARSPSEDLCIVDRAGIESCQRRCQRSCQRAIRTGGNGRVIIIDCRGKNWRVIVAQSGARRRPWRGHRAVTHPSSPPASFDSFMRSSKRPSCSPAGSRLFATAAVIAALGSVNLLPLCAGPN